MTDEKTAAAAAAPAETIEDVRELLFGADKRVADDRIEKLDAKLAQLDAKLAQIDARQSELDARQAQLDAGQAQLDSRVSRIAQIEGRFAQVDNQFAQFEKWLEQLDTRLGQGLGALIQEKRAADLQFKQLGDRLDDMQAEVIAHQRAGEARFAAASAETGVAVARTDALAQAFAEAVARLERLETGLNDVLRERGLGAAIGWSLRNFSTTSRSR